MLSSTVLISDASGKVLQRYRYDPFGEIEQAKGNSDNRFLFNGKEADESGLSYYGARYYNSITGRWISRDPNVGSIFRPDGLNRFLFCYNNPIKKIDKNGEEAQPVSLYSGQTSYLNSVVLQPYIPRLVPLTPEDIAKLPVNYKELYDRPNYILIGLNKDKDTGEIFPDYLDKGGVESVIDPISEAILLGAAFKIAGNFLKPITEFQGHHWWPKELGGLNRGGALVKVPSAYPNLHTAMKGIHPEMRAFFKEQFAKSTWKEAKEEFLKLNFNTQKRLLGDFYKTQGMKMPDMVVPGVIKK